MSRYICPVCDRAMKGTHYCSYCRQLVRNPYTASYNFYLNERHPSGETDCEYHGLSAGGEAKRIPAPGRDAPSPQRTPQENKRILNDGWERIGRQIRAEIPRPRGPVLTSFTGNRRHTEGSAGTVGWLMVIFIVMIYCFSSCAARF